MTTKGSNGGGGGGGGASPVVDSLRQLFLRGDYEGVVQRVEQHVKKRRSNSAVVEAARIAALIHLGRGAEAKPLFEALEETPNAEGSVGHFLSLARPYLAWAGAGNVSEALDAVSKLEGDDARKIEAQLLYRLGRYDEASAVYERLSAAVDAELNASKPVASRWTLRSAAATQLPLTAAEKEALRQNVAELTTNRMATLVLAGRHDEALAVKEGKAASYELEYNATCASIGSGDHQLADVCLEQAEQLMLADGEEDDDIDADMAPVRVQRAYLKQLGGNVMEARDEYNDIVSNKRADPASLAVAANNLAVAMGQLAFDTKLRELEANKQHVHTGSETDGAGATRNESQLKAERVQHAALGEGLKKMRATAGTKVEGKLTDVQRRAMARNRAILLVQMGRLDGCRREVDRLKEAYPGDQLNALIEAAMLAKRSDPVAADKLLSAAGDSPLLAAARVQLAEDAGDRKRAAELLVELFPQRPAAVATAADILESLGERAAALELLQAAAKERPAHVPTQRAHAALLTRMERHADAAKVLDALLKAEPDNAVVRAELVVALSFVDAERAEQLAARLPPPPAAPPTAVTGAELESMPPPKRRGGTVAIAKPAAAAAAAAAATTADGTEAKKKKKRKKRLPKNYDPNGPPPDPERWLPKSQRAGYKKKNKKRDDGNFRGSQGAAAAEAEAAAVKNAERAAAKARAAEEPAAPAANRPKGAKPKKKKRRG